MGEGYHAAGITEHATDAAYLAIPHGNGHVPVNAATTTIHTHDDARYDNLAIALGQDEYRRLSMQRQSVRYLAGLLIDMEIPHMHHRQPDESTIAWYRRRFLLPLNKENNKHV